MCIYGSLDIGERLIRPCLKTHHLLQSHEGDADEGGSAVISDGGGTVAASSVVPDDPEEQAMRAIVDAAVREQLPLPGYMGWPPDSPCI